MKIKEEQGNVRNEDLKVECSKLQGNFDWYKISKGNFDVFYEKYPKKISEYPKVMWVSENKDFICKQKRVVFMEKSGLFIAWNNAETIEDSELSMDIISWRYAKDIDTLIVTKQQIADKFGIDINDLIIE